MTATDKSAQRGANDRTVSVRSYVRSIWQGSPRPRAGCTAFFAVVISFGLAPGFYRLGLEMLRWSMPQQLFGWLIFLIAVALLVWGVRSGIRIFLQLGIRRILVRLAFMSAFAMLVTGFVVPSGYSGLYHWLVTAQRVLGWSIAGLNVFWNGVIEAPSEVQFAATGKRPPLRVPGVEWDNGPPPPVVVRVSESGDLSVVTPSITELQESSPVGAEAPVAPTLAATSEITIGSAVQVAGTDGAPLRARAQPSRESAVVTRFPEGARLLVVDGPKEAEGLTWWRVRGDAGEGWCVSDFLRIAP